MQKYPNIINSYDVVWLGNLLGLCMLLAFSIFVINTVGYIVMEKERQLKEVLQIIGISNCMYWGSWFVRTIIYLIISSTLMVAAMKVI